MEKSAEAVAREILDIVPTIMRVIRTEIRGQRSSDLAVPQFRALLFIYRNPGSTLLALADHLGLTPPTVSKLVDGLVHKHLVGRAVSLRDRRKVTLSLTTKGKTNLDIVFKGAQARLSEALSTLTPEEGEKVYQALKILRPLFISGNVLGDHALEGRQI